MPTNTRPQHRTSWCCRIVAATLLAMLAAPASAQIAVRGETVYTMAGEPLHNGVVLIRDGKIAAIGGADDIEVPEDFRTLEAKVVTPGLIDAHSTVGLSGIFNYAHDQDQLESSSPIQPELRAVDAYNAREELVEWVRSFGVTTVHTGHGPGELVSGQTIVVKTAGPTVEAATLVDCCAVAATLDTSAQKEESNSPGTRAKMMAMLREQFIKAQEYRAKLNRIQRDETEDGANPSTEADEAEEDEVEEEPVSRDLKLETLVRVLNRELPLMVTAHRAQDIANALRLAKEFDLRLWIDGAAEAHLLVAEIKAAGVPVLIHPLMVRPFGDLENVSFETPAKLIAAGIPVAYQSGYESYVPKTRVVLFEAAMAASNGVGFDRALAGVTLDAAKILGIEDRVGSLEVGKHGDLALFDGDPFEYTSHCVGVVIEGKVVSDAKH